ncbi:Uma2 family endonuclease [Acaryochloris marina]|uniref:Uma2 family endonuclease n=1 Tax=Acaryochloris marina TaxID=155978 RepID=UPI001BAE6701|nr:Uma2 family endonuclease [Acaryochloris marina]QUY40597.1 Uma2 family endonuclease [Acaryochloris marina S15]
MQLIESKPVLLDVRGITLHVTPADFERLCQDNPELRLELAASGELITMPPAGWESSKRNSELNRLVGNWNQETLLGEVFDSSVGFTLPNGAIRSPDVSWIAASKLEGVSNDIAFPAIVPDFVIELRSKTDALKTLQEKMKEYQGAGVRLGWLIDPQNQQVEIYRLSKDVEIRRLPTVLEGEDVLPGLTINFTWMSR